MSVLALGLAILLSAFSAFGDSLPLPVEKKIPAGETTIEYVGQSLRFTTSVPLLVRLGPIGLTRIQYQVKVQPGYSVPNGPVGSSENNLEIFWVNIGADVYQGGLPSGSIEGTLNTEGGFVDR